MDTATKGGNFDPTTHIWFRPVHSLIHWASEKMVFWENNILETFTHNGSKEIYYINDRVLLRHFKKISNYLYSKLPRNEKDHKLQPRDFVYWKGHQIKDSLQPQWEEPYQVLVTNSCTAKLKDINSWFTSHFKKPPPPEWTLTPVSTPGFN